MSLEVHNLIPLEIVRGDSQTQVNSMCSPGIHDEQKSFDNLNNQRPGVTTVNPNFLLIENIVLSRQPQSRETASIHQAKQNKRQEYEKVSSTTTVANQNPTIMITRH